MGDFPQIGLACSRLGAAATKTLPGQNLSRGSAMQILTSEQISHSASIFPNSANYGDIGDVGNVGANFARCWPILGKLDQVGREVDQCWAIPANFSAVVAFWGGDVSQFGAISGDDGGDVDPFRSCWANLP